MQYIKFAFMQIMLIYVNVYMYLCWNKKFFTIYIYFICFFCHFVRTDIGLKQLDISLPKLHLLDTLEQRKVNVTK